MERHHISKLIIPLLFVAHFLLLADPSQLEVSTKEKLHSMKEKYEALTRRIDTAEGSHEWGVLYQIGADIDSFPLAMKKDPEWRNWRRAKLELWLKAIDLIDRTKDPAFNPEDVPQLNVAPPPGSTISAGASPGAIQDPRLRHEYEQAIKRNAEKAERYNLQDGLRKLDSLWTESIRVYIVGQYNAEPQDVSEIRTLIDEQVSTDPRKEQIRNFIVSRGKPQR